MNKISISQLKVRPAQVIAAAAEYPVAVQSRNQTKAYLLGEKLYKKLICYIEDYIDREAVRHTDFKKGKNFEKVASQLGI
jgi:PHD/YefM family antitoxin component YafN of YafNO toxin-antitoxin module